MSVRFCTVVNYRDPQTVSQKLLGFADSYLTLGCGRVEVILGFTKDGKEAVIHDSRRSSCLVTALKIVSYFTLILPLLALITKIVLRCTHRFYPIDPKRVAEEEVLKKVRAGKPLSNEDLQSLPLSRLTKAEIRSIFNLDISSAKLPELRARFACVPASEVAEALYKGILPNRHYILISDSQCRALDIAKSEKVLQANFESSVNAENLEAHETLRDAEVDDTNGIFERMQSKIANIDLDKLIDVLHQRDDCDDIYHFLTNDQLPKLKIGSFDEGMIEYLIEGLYRRPKCIFGEFDIELMVEEKPLAEARARFALLNADELKQVVKNGNIDRGALIHLVSDPQFKSLDFSEMDLNGFLKIDDDEDDEVVMDRLKHLYSLIPQEEIQKAIAEERLDQATADDFAS